jgi:phytanoyl-CoA hydroxylase
MSAGNTLGREIEADFTRKARESGLTDDEAKDAFNQNMLSTGLLADGPREYSETFGRRWLVTSYEAGDVVLHTPYTVRTFRKTSVALLTRLLDPRVNIEFRP